tara:strand:- start:496 stop:621 length:126 start_codon:yes stop_codon:yes gene_type:complete
VALLLAVEVVPLAAGVVPLVEEEVLLEAALLLLAMVEAEAW